MTQHFLAARSACAHEARIVRCVRARQGGTSVANVVDVQPLAVTTGLFALLLSSACVESAHVEPAEPVATHDPHADSWTPQSPQEKWWEHAQPCPEGSKLVGAPPPKGQALECVNAEGKRHGLSSIWFGSGYAGTTAEYQNGVPHGRWLYWLHAHKLIEGQHEQGRRQGKWTYWFTTCQHSVLRTS